MSLPRATKPAVLEPSVENPPRVGTDLCPLGGRRSPAPEMNCGRTNRARQSEDIPGHPGKRAGRQSSASALSTRKHAALSCKNPETFKNQSGNHLGGPLQTRFPVHSERQAPFTRKRPEERPRWGKPQCNVNSARQSPVLAARSPRRVAELKGPSPLRPFPPVERPHALVTHHLGLEGQTYATKNDNCSASLVAR